MESTTSDTPGGQEPWQVQTCGISRATVPFTAAVSGPAEHVGGGTTKMSISRLPIRSWATLPRNKSLVLRQPSPADHEKIRLGLVHQIRDGTRPSTLEDASAVV